MSHKYNSKIFYWLAALVITVNALVFARVAYNRSEDTALLTLTERELSMPMYISDDNSGLLLHINYRVVTTEINYYNAYGNNSPAWLTRDKMRALGFPERASDNIQDYFSDRESREVYLALEYDGEAYQRMLENVRQWHGQRIENKPSEQDLIHIDNRLDLEENRASRLFVIDADSDLESLRNKYKNNENVVIVNGVIRERGNTNVETWFTANDSVEQGDGYIESLSISSINVPSPDNAQLKNMTANKERHNGTLRYTVKLAFGRLREPYIVDINILSDQ